MQEEIQNSKNEALAQIIQAAGIADLESIRISYLGRNGKINQLTKNIKSAPDNQRKLLGLAVNEAKKTIDRALKDRHNSFKNTAREWFDASVPGIIPDTGHLHLVSQAIDQISNTFERIGFIRRRYFEVEWDYFAFESLNMPSNHPARDEWETFFIDKHPHPKYGSIVLTPHTSNGQVREMLRMKKPPIRMINITKCYRRQSDVSHVPVFHQFEGLVIDEQISLKHLKGTLDYFAQNYFGNGRKIRLRPYHFRFTEPSFEVDIDCDLCHGKGCRVCKSGWLELGGAGMVHPNVLKHGGIDSSRYSGFAFGWGVERALMMKSGLKLPDIRLLYSTDINYLTQF